MPIRCWRPVASTRCWVRVTRRTPGSNISPTHSGRDTSSAIHGSWRSWRGRRQTRCVSWRPGAAASRRSRMAGWTSASSARISIGGPATPATTPGARFSTRWQARHKNWGSRLSRTNTFRACSLPMASVLAPMGSTSYPASAPSSKPTPSSWRPGATRGCGVAAHRAATRTMARACTWRSRPAAA